MNNNNFFKVPKLSEDGFLHEDDALAIYKHYLTQEREDFYKKMTRPCRSATFKNILDAHINYSAGSSKLIQDHVDNGRRLLFWSDQHFFHKNIIEYANRPFENNAHMHNVMLENYYKEVNDDDMVIFGGDISFGSFEDTKGILDNLPGKKVLIIGNHDLDRKYKFIDYNVFDATSMICVFNKKINNKIANIVITHYPIANIYLPKNTINIHGHIHQYQADKKNINMSVEHMEYMPKVLDKEIEQLFTFMEIY